jgi:DNA polymerase I-like protein with 3'-5' exonuclease and polymerase domains
MIHPKSIEAYNLLHEGTIALAHAEQAGFRVDMEYLEQKKVHLTRKINHYETKFRESALFRHWEHHSKGKINIHSNAQIANFLYNVKKLTPAYLTESGQEPQMKMP